MELETEAQVFQTLEILSSCKNSHCTATDMTSQPHTNAGSRERAEEAGRWSEWHF